MSLQYDSDMGGTPSATSPIQRTSSPVGTPAGVLAFLPQQAGSDDVTSGTYGGVAMSEVTGSPWEAQGSCVSAFFLGSSIPTGSQTLSFTIGGAQTCSLFGVIVSSTVGADAQVEATDSFNFAFNNPEDADTIALGGVECFVAEGFYSNEGNVNNLNAQTGWTSRRENDYGAQTSGMYTYDTVGTSDVSYGVAYVGSAAFLVAAVALSEAGGLSATVNQATETNLAQSIGVGKFVAVGQVTETDLAQDVTEVSQTTVLLGQPDEENNAQVVSSAKALAIGQPSETDLAQTVSSSFGSTIGQASEADLSQAVAPRKEETLEEASVSEEAFAVTFSSSATIQQVSETDEAQALAVALSVVLGQVSETDFAQPVLTAGIFNVERASETDAALALAASQKTQAVGQVTETDLAQTVSTQIAVTLGQPAETNLSQALAGVEKGVGILMVAEVDFAFPLVGQAAAGGVSFSSGYFAWPSGWFFLR